MSRLADLGLVSTGKVTRGGDKPCHNSMTRFQWVAACILLAAGSPAMVIDEPRYTVLRTYDAFEVRRYEPYLVAETVVSASADEAGNEGFRVLAGYIFGGNKGDRRIEMTAPVAQSPA